MKRSEIRTFIEDGVQELNPSVSFGSGLITFFNSKRSNSYPYVFWESVSSSGDGSESAELVTYTQIPLDAWDIKLHIADLDAMDSIPDQYELIIDRMDELAQKLITKYNQVVSGYKNVAIEGINRTPFVHMHADCLTGVILSFTLTAADKTNNC